MDKKSLEKVYKAGLKFLQPLSTQEVLEVICKEAIKIVNGEFASIFLEVNGELKRVYSTSPVLGKIQIRKNGYTYKVYRTQQPKVLNSDIIAKIHPEIKQITARSDILVPLISQGKSIGVFTVLSSSSVQFTQEEMKVLTLFGPMASLAIRKAQLYEETKKALETRDLFISMAAHELRTPLTTINGYIQLLNSRLSKKPDTVESRWIYELSREATRMTHLINELLEVNRIKSGELNYHFQAYHIKDVIERVMRNLKLIYPDHQIIYEDKIKEKNDLIIGDFEKLMQAVTNLVDNSIKFSPVEKPLQIVLSSNNDTVFIMIKDQGRGIPKKDIPNIFEGYYRAENHDVEGMGLGLYLVKNITKMHRGEVKVLSTLGKGTSFIIQLPLYQNYQNAY